MTQTNPLVNHFRQPSIFLKLPSQGSYWPDGALSFTVTGELPVYPMTTKDEIVLRTPDSLINGSGVVEVIKSCIPNIVDPWATPSIDIDACLIAIRIASYGTDMNISSLCPNCKSTNDHTIELSSALDQITMPDYTQLLEADGLKFKFKPQPYFSINRSNAIAFKEQRILDTIEKADISPEEREINIKQITEEMVDLNFESLANSTDYVITSDNVRVTDVKFIKEFYSNAQSSLIRKIQLKIAEISENSGLKPYHVKCSHCEHEYKSLIEFDYASFFEVGS